MNRILKRRAWLRWVLLLPFLGVFEESSCAVSDAMRETADGLQSAANSLDGEEDSTSELDQLVKDFDKLFHDD